MAIYPSNLIQQGGGIAAPSMIPGTMRPVTGMILVPAGVTLAANDTLPLFYLSAGAGAHIFSVWIGTQALDSGATVTISLVDSATPTPNVLMVPSNTFRAGGVITDAQMAVNGMGLGQTYTSPTNLIQLLVNAGAGAAVAAGGARVYFNFGISTQ